MKLIEVKNYEEMSEQAASEVIKQVRIKPDSVLGLATGGTPVGMYQYIIKDFMGNGTSYQDVVTMNLDEYIGVSQDNEQSYHYYMRENLFKHIDLRPENTYLPTARNIEDNEAGVKYEKLIDSAGGIDLQILGIGENGHIGFNEPGTSFDSITGIVKLTESTIKANARYFQSIEEVPTHAISMGISTIMKSKKILLLISGKKKAQIVDQLLKSEVNENLPASILKNHSNVIMIADQEALSVFKENKGSVYS
ncbi:glucosamine-6-phosphate deaminase [Bacillus sp. B1-b2]|uniref:glucosamine-6-phosphate deaminase n=1 Tax=Bacillus sp. B1-b2 TaxID=2653201 RepID=UPI001261AFB9|nr:glucosamine-6-phosphate deaminase [Bacillus sp. B1-b2]KAB7667606.1 glucosamine-6-phosphate deaminase [Bacillus sp. B1-b2]